MGVLLIQLLQYYVRQPLTELFSYKKNSCDRQVEGAKIMLIKEIFLLDGLYINFLALSRIGMLLQIHTIFVETVKV